MSSRTRQHRGELRAIARRVMIERGLEPDFSPAVLAETNAITRPADDRDSAIRDLRHLLWASIDNDDSRDLDQLSVAEPAGGDTVRVCVAIADVDAVVRKGSAIDGHARTNTTSISTAAEVFPMLPEKLSTDLTSLGEGDERLALVVEMTVGTDGSVASGDVYRARVVNHAKLAYNAVAAWLDATAPAPPRIAAVPGLDGQLRLQDRVARAMKDLRHRRGALSLETLELRLVFDGDMLADLAAFPRCVGSSAPPSAGSASSSWRRAWVSGCRRRRTHARSKPFSERDGGRIRRASPTCRSRW